MKKVFSWFLLIAIVLSFAGCEEVTPDNYTIDYYDAASFEKALNDGKDVKGKVVQFYVTEYAPDSFIGINCHAGEHLNFIFEEELDVEAGDTIIAHVTEEASKIFLIGSWKIRCEVFEIIKAQEETQGTTVPTEIQTEPMTEPTEPTTVPTVPTTMPTEPTNPVTEPTKAPNTKIVMTSDATAYVGKSPRDVEKELKELGFVNISWIGNTTTDTTKADGMVSSVTAESKGFVKGDAFDKDTVIVIAYWKVQKPKLEIVFPKTGTKLAKDFDTKGTYTAYYSNVDGVKNTPKLNKWKGITVTDGVAEYLDYLEELGFKVTVTNNSQREPYAGFTLYEIDFTVSKEDFSWTMYLMIQDEDYVEYEFGINLT